MTYRLLIVDAQFLAHRKFSGSGRLAGGFLWTLLDLMDAWTPGLIYCAWDDPAGASRRREMHPGYKVGRAPKKPELFRQIAQLRQMLSWIGVTQFSSTLGEGDDVIATLARGWPGPQLIYTADKDLLQLVRPRVHVLKAGCGGKSDQLATDENCKVVTGWTPSEWTDYLTITGDVVDKVPGVPGIGPAWAKRLIDAVPGFCERLLGEVDRDDEIRKLAAAADNAQLGKRVEQCIAARESVRLTRRLIELYDVALDIQQAEPDAAMAAAWLRAREMDHLVRRLR